MGCPGCRAVNRGLPAAGHTGECRKRLEEALEKEEDDRVKRQRSRFEEYEKDKQEEPEVKKARGRKGKEAEEEPVKDQVGGSSPSGVKRDKEGRAVEQEMKPADPKIARLDWRGRPVTQDDLDENGRVKRVREERAEGGGAEDQQPGEGAIRAEVAHQGGGDQAKGVKRVTDEWDTFAKRLKEGAEKKQGGRRGTG